MKVSSCKFQSNPFLHKPLCSYIKLDLLTYQEIGLVREGRGGRGRTGRRRGSGERGGRGWRCRGKVVHYTINIYVTNSSVYSNMIQQ